MSAFRNVTFGEHVFSRIDDNTYLKKLYQNILFNYSKKLFHLEDLEDRPVNVEDALTFADILSKSYGTSLSDIHKTRAQEMVALMLEIYPDNELVKHYLGSVLANTGNFLGMDRLTPEFENPSVLERLYMHFNMHRFFKDVDGIKVFDKIGFAWVINNRQFLPDSYTRFKNKIGLADENGDLISSSGKVELVFPYKDCVLEGGQTKEDQKRSEIFYNESLAPDEVDRLLYPKVFANAKRYTADGVEENITFDENDNLIIKGNNLLAISSLLKRYEGQIKCIFIDIPYNTGNDGFQYNDNFNHSTWLTFMKNRLELAQRLLSPDGSIAIYVDNNEIGYLQVLMDEVFGRLNRGSLITVKRGSVTGHKAINPGVVNVVEYIMIYAKSKPQWNPNKIYKARSRNDRYNNFVVNRDKDISQWEFISLLDAFSKHKGVEKSKLKKSLGSDYEKELYKFVIDNAESVIQFAYPDVDAVGQETRELIAASKLS